MIVVPSSSQPSSLSLPFLQSSSNGRRGGGAGTSGGGAASSSSCRRNLVLLGALAAQAALLCGYLLSAPTGFSSSMSYASSSQQYLLSTSYGDEPARPPRALRKAVVDGSSTNADDDRQVDMDGIDAVAARVIAKLALRSPLIVPPGQPPNLPRLGIAAATTSAAGNDKEEQDEDSSAGEANADADVAAAVKADAKRSFYGGKGDGKHLGGFTEFDHHGVAPSTWAHMITNLGVRSVLDVGCGRGISTRWFLEHNASVLCVEGSKDAIRQSFLPPELIVEHDYSRGPWWPRDTYDAAWSVEFLEHVSRPFMRNYIQTLRKAAIIFVTSSRWGGWHHVEIHNDEWWIRKFTSYGFVYDDKLTKTVRQWARQEWKTNYTLPNGKASGPQHVSMSMKVFLNPAVASLPEHEHLFPEHGCLGDPRPGHNWQDGGLPFLPRKCGVGRKGSQETPLAESFLPLPVDMRMHERWMDVIRAGIKLPDNDEPSKVDAKQ